MKIAHDRLWAGTEESHQASLEMDQTIQTRLVAGVLPDDEDEQEDGMPYLYERQGNVGVISIKGPLSNRTSDWDSYFGRTTYPAIRDAVIYAANDGEVDQILLDIDSGGGAVAGVEDTANLISMVNTKVKPVTAFSDGTMASAAYWLGASAGGVYATNTTLSGSIGVISTHMEYSKELKDAGVGVTVLRAGKFKALANSFEPLSKEGEAQIQALLDATYTVFVQHVANMRGVTYPDADATMAQGREFVGQAAVNSRLVDGLTTFDALMSKLSADSIDTSNNSIDNAGKLFQGTTMKKALTEKEIAAIAAGAGEMEAEAATKVAAEAEVAAKAEAEAAAKAEAEAAAKAEAEAAAKPAAESESAVVAMLQAQLKDKDQAVLEAGVKLAQQTEKLNEVTATFSGLMAIAAASVNHLSVALGGSKLENLGAAQLVAEYGRLSEAFKSKFKAGGVAAVDAVADASGSKAAANPLHMARVNAARYNAK